MMPSFKGRLCRAYMRKTSNFNIYYTDDVVAKMNRISDKLHNEDYPEGFEFHKEQTPNGTKYERLSRQNVARNGRLILYFHGGAYIAKLFGYYRDFAEDFYYQAGEAETIFLDYKTAPEYQYPTQLNEALDLWHDLTTRQGYQPDEIILGGDSAGANLLLAMMLKLRDDGEQLPLGAFCISAWTDMTGSSKSFHENYGKDVEFGDLKHPVMSRQTKEYLLESDIYSFIGDADRTDPYISPVFGEYHNFPPMMFTIGGDEMLLDDTLTIVEKLKKENIPVLCEIQPDMFHIYATLRDMMPESQHSWNRILKYIRIMYHIQ
ncbi:MAG: alpha/beta hydrolase fold domain-containing protein [Oscillospiraceae bacterium]|nr:alpha/beta hydrolase fold domain-containing protein [Oscillospiraceae bacterium]